MPNSLITRLPNASTSYTLPGGGTVTAVDRRTEMLRKISAQSRRLRGGIGASAAFDVAKKGRIDSLQAVLNRGIIPIHVLPNPSTTLHAYVQAYPGARATGDTVTVVSGAYSKAFANPSNADDATLAATGVTDFTATDSIDASATGIARATIT